MIDHYEFGKFVVDGKTYETDIKIINGQVKTWKDHSMSLEDIQELIDAKPKIIVIGTGSAGMVNVSQEIKEAIKKAGIELYIEKTKEACELYNKLSQQYGKENVAAILHSTC